MDFDNFAADGLPRPRMLGTEIYMAPEVRRGYRSGNTCTPTISSDLWNLAAMLNTLLLARDPGPENDPGTDEFQQAISGAWLDDPRLGDRSVQMGGLPSRVLNREIIELFRHGISPATADRPTAATWRQVLLRAAGAVEACPHCGGESIGDQRRRHCPYCRQPFPVLQIRTAAGTTVTLDHDRIVIGRDDLDGHQTISEVHCRVCRQPPMTTITSLGCNGTYLCASDGNWMRVHDQKPFAIRAGDKLRFADQEVQIEEAG